MKIVQQDAVNFHLTNSIPRRLATRLVGWFSKIENRALCAISLSVWRLFTDLDLSDARETRFRSVHDCFTRRLRDGARPVDPDPTIFVSPCDAIVGACGTIEQGQLLQVKGMSYTLQDLFAGVIPDAALLNGQYVTLRLTSAMYHRFHAPYDCRVTEVTHLFGDVWNVNPPTLKRIARLFCKNERVLIRTHLPGAGQEVMLVAVAAILVAGIRLSFIDLSEQDRASQKTNYLCDQMVPKGAEMGWFEHGSTILVFAPTGFRLFDGITEGVTIRAGRPLMRLPRPAPNGQREGAA